jgi:hypothetical protein
MKDILKWVCECLLLDPFEFCYFIHIINQDAFDIIRVRDMSMLGNYLKFDYFLLFIGLHIKVQLNEWRQTKFSPEDLESPLISDSHFLSTMLKSLAT